MKLIIEKKWIAILGFILVFLVGVGAFLFLQMKNNEVNQNTDVFQSLTAETEDETIVDESEATEVLIKKVDIKGAVVSPGLYIAEEGERVLDLIEKAGGLAKDADSSGINFAQRVEDQMVIYVPKKGEKNLPAINSVAAASIDMDSEGGMVNINTADESELQTLTGIGPSKATAIIQYRTEKGPFKKIEDLKNVSGIGDKTFEKLKEEITIQ